MSYSLEEPLYVVGHKNPDTDAICSAIGQAALLSAIGYQQVEAIRCGEIPERTQWALDQAGLLAPRLVTDVRSTAADLVNNKGYHVCSTSTILTAYRTMLEAGMKCVPVVRNTNKVVGMLKLVDLLQLMMPTQTHGLPVKTVFASLANAVIALDGESVGADLPDATVEEELILFVAASSPDTLRIRLTAGEVSSKVSRRIAICGDRPNVQELVIEEGVRGLVISGGFKMTDDLLEKAKQKGIAVIYSNHDTATTVQLMRCSPSVKGALSVDFICVQEGEAISSFKHRLSASDQDIFPVVASGSLALVGTFSKSDLISPPRKRLVLVDHNEYSQAVKGVEEAQVIEVIDHHRLAGNIVSREPITYLNEPVGSTCTLVARKFMYRNLKPSRGVALCLCAGLISDTLNLTSPTTTDLDREMLAWLCDIAEIKAAEFTKGFFEAGSLLLHGTSDDIVGVDRKEFNEGGAFVSISQVEEIGISSLPTRIDEIRASLQKLVDSMGYDIAMIAVTDISSHTSTILVAGSEKIANAIPYEQSEPGVWSAPGVVSRKKQIFPAMCQAIYNSSATEVEV